MIDLIPDYISDKYEVVNYHHAAEVICSAFPEEWNDLMVCFKSFSLSQQDISASGGAETSIPGKVNSILYPRRWRNVMAEADLKLRLYQRKIDQKQYEEYPYDEPEIHNYVQGHHVDFMKSRVALCVEWNKKDVSYDRVLASLRSFYELNIISAGVVLTRGETLDKAFSRIIDKNGNSVKSKYGASSTHIDRLIPRVESGQAGGCPILILGIRDVCVID